MDDISKLMQKKVNTSEEDRAKLDAYLRGQGMSPETKKNPFEAQVLKARQDASETTLGGLLGMSPLSEEEKQFQIANRDPNLEKGMDMALQLGMEALEMAFSPDWKDFFEARIKASNE